MPQTEERIGAPQQTPGEQASLEVFDSVRKGDPAPEWVTAGLRAGWPQLPIAAVSLIAVSENATFRVDGPAGPIGVLRLSRPGYVADPAQIESELSWMQAISNDTEVPVPSVIRPGTSPSTVVVIVDEHGAGWFSVMTGFISGEVLEGVGDPTPYYEQIGAYTAMLHRHSRGWRRPDRFVRFQWEPDDMVGARSRWGDWRNADLSAQQQDVLERAERVALDRVLGHPRTPETWGIIHADLRASNILINGESLTVIDFDDCGECWYLWDFAAALSFGEHESYAPEIAQRWMQGYSRIRPLDDDDRAFACDLSMLRRLQMLGWTTTHRADALPAEQWAAQIPGTEEVARRYLADRLWLLR